MERGRNSRKKLMNLRSEKGYLMLSTLYLIILTGIFSHSIIKTSVNYIIQLNQISSVYQTKAALNMTERILKDYIIDNNYELPEKIKLSSSIGDIKAIKISDDEYEVIITQGNGNKLNEKIEIKNDENEDDKIELQDTNNETENNMIYDQDETDNSIMNAPKLIKDVLEKESEN